MSISRASWVVVAVTGLSTVSGVARAHFVLQSPAAMYEQNNLGDPQKVPPCGDNGSAVATNMVTTVEAGDTITITIDETIYHPGHYRIALAVDGPGGLPDDPIVEEIPGDECGSTTIQDPPVFPVLADGMLPHSQAFAGPQTIEVQIPEDVSCDACTLQVIQYMSSHGAPCFYHHCATLEVLPAGVDPGMTDDGGDDDPMDGTTSGPAATSGDDATADAGATAADDGDGGDDGTMLPDTDTDTDPTATGDEDDGGCACALRRGSRDRDPTLLLGLLALAGLTRRRRGSLE